MLGVSRSSSPGAGPSSNVNSTDSESEIDTENKNVMLSRDLGNSWTCCVEFKLAVQNRNVEHVRWLVKHHNVDVDHQFWPTKSSAMHLVAQETNNQQMLQCLLQLGASVNLTDIRGRTPLMCACEGNNNNINVVKRLIQERAALNARDNLGWSAIHRAVAHRNTELVETLLNAGADVNIASNNYQTPLHFAVDGRWYTGVMQLVFAGADASIRDAHGWSAFFHLSALTVDSSLPLNVRHALLWLMLRLGAVQLGREYWATAKNPELLLPVHQTTLSWFDTVRPTFVPQSLSLLCRASLLQKHGARLRLELENKNIPTSVYGYLLGIEERAELEWLLSTML